MFKIKPLHLYKLKNKSNKAHFVLDVVNARRVAILTTLAVCLIATYLLQHAEEFVIQPATETHQHLAYRQFKASPADQNIKIIELEILKTNSTVSRQTAKDLSRTIVNAANKYDLDPLLLCALIKIESRFNQYSISSSNALGYTQIIPKWHKDKIMEMKKSFGEFYIFDAKHNIMLGAYILSDYKKRYKTLYSTLLQYNGTLKNDAGYAKKVLDEYKKLKATNTPMDSVRA